MKKEIPGGLFGFTYKSKKELQSDYMRAEL